MAATAVVTTYPSGRWFVCLRSGYRQMSAKQMFQINSVRALRPHSIFFLPSTFHQLLVKHAARCCCQPFYLACFMVRLRCLFSERGLHVYSSALATPFTQRDIHLDTWLTSPSMKSRAASSLSTRESVLLRRTPTIVIGVVVALFCSILVISVWRFIVSYRRHVPVDHAALDDEREKLRREMSQVG